MNTVAYFTFYIANVTCNKWENIAQMLDGDIVTLSSINFQMPT